MKKLFWLVVLFCISSPLTAAETQRYVVATREGVRAAALTALRDPIDLSEREVRTFQNLSAFAVDLTEEEARELSRAGNVRYIQRVVPRQASTIRLVGPVEAHSYETEQTIPWGLDAIRTRSVWPATRGAGVNVAFIDTGVDADHPDLRGQIAGGTNVFGRNENFADDNFHGTHVAGTVGALDNRFGIVGIAPEAKLWAVKALDKNGFGNDETVAAGIDWVMRKKKELGGNWIISMSIGSGQPSDLEKEMVARAIDDDILLIAAAGNSGFAVVEYPAAYPFVVSVGALNQSDQRSGFSGHGKLLHLIAPGERIPSTMPQGLYAEAEIVAPQGALNAAPLAGSAKGAISGRYVYCGLGREGEFPPSVAGNIAVVRRGEIYFRDKGRNARAAGARALVIIDDGREDRDIWTLLPPFCDEQRNCAPLPEDVAFDWPVTVSLSQADGERLLGISDLVTVSYQYKDYALGDGTSMATPHVSALAALLWSLKPQATAEELRVTLRYTARDLGLPNWDIEYGFGAVDAFNAARWLAPTAFGLPEHAPPPSFRRPAAKR